MKKWVIYGIVIGFITGLVVLELLGKSDDT